MHSSRTIGIGKSVPILLWAILLTIGLSACTEGDASIVERNIPTAYIQSDYVVNVDEPRELVGLVGYVFVGYVEAVEGVEYKWPIMVTNEEGEAVEDTIPYTNYEITVLKNIKGNLELTTIPVQKLGGISKDESQYILPEGDVLPKPGGIYIFCALADEDGALHISGKNSNIPIDISYDIESYDATSIDGIVSSDEYKTMDAAYSNEVPSPVEMNQYKSTYDAG